MTKETEELIVNNINLAYAIANKYAPKVSSIFEYEEVTGICLEALVNAALNYDSTKNVKFSTYAYTVVKNNLFSLYNWQFKKRNNLSLISLDEPQTDDGETLYGIVADDINLEKDYIDNEDILQLYEYIFELPDELNQIINLHLQGNSFEKIGNIINKSSAYTYTQYQRALNILRTKYRKDSFYE